MRTSLILLTVVLAAGHHSVTKTYDSSKTVSLSGVIVKVELINPHARLELRSTDVDGNVTTWTIEMAPPRVIQRNGDLKSLEVGRPVIIEAWLAKDGEKLASGRTLVTSDGRRLDIADKWM